MTIRPINLEVDYPVLQKWWAGHKALPMPQYVFPRGWMIGAGGVDIAASFLFLDVDGHFAVIEFLTTNPAVAFSRTLVEAVRQLINHIEAEALARGCKFIISFVAPGTGEERLMARIGYTTSPGPSHRLWAKPLKPTEGT